MVRWWNVTDVTPSGLRLNRAWHIRQLFFALATPAATLVFLHFVSRWEEDLMRDRAKEAEAKVKTNASENANVSSLPLPEQRTPVPPASSTNMVKSFIMSYIPEEYKETLTIDKLFMNRIRDFASTKDDSAEANPFLEALRDTVLKALSPSQGVALDEKGGTEQPLELKTELISPMRYRREKRNQLKQQELKQEQLEKRGPEQDSAPAPPTKASGRVASE